MQAAGGNLHRYLSRLLDVSRLVNRLQSGGEAIVCSEFSLASVFSELRYDFLDLTGARVDVARGRRPPTLYTDREKLVTILRNLIENALKYSDGSPATVGRARDERATRSSLTVADRGIGISADELPHIFDPFRRTATAVATQTPRASGSASTSSSSSPSCSTAPSRWSRRAGIGSTFTVRIPRQLRRPPRRAQRAASARARLA